MKSVISNTCLLACLGICWFASAQEVTRDDSVSIEINPGEAKLTSLSERFELGEELIVTIRLGQLNYGEVFTVVTETGLFVNAEEFIALLDFPINKFSNDEAYLLKGWFISEDRTFELRFFDSFDDKGVGEVNIAGKNRFIQRNEYMELGGERLINFDLVGSWFGLALTFDSQSLSVNMSASIPLPAQSKLAREKRKVNDRGHAIPKYPNYDFGYFSRSHQIFDASINSTYSADNINSFYSVVGIQDVAGLSTRFFFRGTDQDVLEAANINFRRQSINSNLLGPLKASSIEFGDIRSTRVAGSTGGQSVGLTISNQKLGHPFDFEFTNITGVIQEGWDVELYQNGVLTRKDLNTSGGQYEFLDLPLFGQLNTFDIVKYGPQGQVERERVERNIDLQTFSETPRYSLSLSQSNRSLLLDNSENNDEQELFLSGAYNYALSSWLSTRFSHNINLSDSTGFYSIGGAARILPRLLSNFSYNYANSEQQSLAVSFQSRLFEQFVNASYSHNIQGADNYSNDFSLRMLGDLYQGDIGRIAYSNDFSLNEQKNGDYLQKLGNTLTLTSRYGFLSHNFFHQAERNGIIRDTFSSGGITFGGHSGYLSTRFNASYDIASEDEEFSWKSLEASLNYEFDNDLSVRFNVSRALETKFDNYRLGAQWSQPNYALFGSLNHDSNNNTSISLNARFSMSEAPFGKGYISSGNSLTSNALVAVRVYEDINQNYIFDGDDRVIPNVKVRAQQLNKTVKSGDDGIAIFEGVQSFRQSDLLVDVESLDDPYLLQSTQNTSLTPRGGLLTLVNYPFIQGIEFEGELTVISTKNNNVDYLKNAPIEIYRSNGELVKVIKSEYDGYFYSGVLFPDKYTLKVSEEYLQRNEVSAKQKIVINASKAGSFIPDVRVQTEKLDYIDGYRPTIAAFSEIEVAKVYINVFRNRAVASFKSEEVSLYRSSKDDKYYVGFNVYESEDQAQKFCEVNSNVISNCKVEKDRYHYPNKTGDNLRYAQTLK